MNKSQMYGLLQKKQLETDWDNPESVREYNRYAQYLREQLNRGNCMYMGTIYVGDKFILDTGRIIEVFSIQDNKNGYGKVALCVDDTGRRITYGLEALRHCYMTRIYRRND